MGATQRHLVALVLLAAFVGSGARPVSHRSLDARGSQATIQFDSLVVSPLRFSPNHDGIQDSVKVSYVLFESTTVDVVVKRPGAATLLDSLLKSSLQAPGRHRVAWDGDSLGVVPEDGDYTVQLAGLTRSGMPLANERTVRIDTTSPQVQILLIEPPILLGTPPANGVRLHVRVSQSELGDSLRAVLAPPVPTGVDSVLKAESAFAGDGDYVMTMLKTSAERLPEGRRLLRARVADRAGNHRQATAVLDVEVRGPTITLLHPSNLNPIAVQHADSITGRVFDRNGLSNLRLLFTSATDTLSQDVLLHAPVPPDSASRFNVDVSVMAAAEGRYGLKLVAQDALSLADTLERILEVDRTDPSNLVFDPAPSSATTSAVVSMRIVVDSTMARVVRSGGSRPPEEQSVGAATRLSFAVNLNSGLNQISFAAFDRAANASVPLTTSVTWSPAASVTAPDRFRAGDLVRVDVGGTTPAAVEVRIYDMSGNLVRKLEPFPSPAALVHSLSWDLRNGDHVAVKNGAFLVQARIRPVGGGSELRAQTAIAVVE
jgi:hypothetical protein